VQVGWSFETWSLFVLRLGRYRRPFVSWKAWWLMLRAAAVSKRQQAASGVGWTAGADDQISDYTTNPEMDAGWCLRLGTRYGIVQFCRKMLQVQMEREPSRDVENDVTMMKCSRSWQRRNSAADSKCRGDNLRQKAATTQTLTPILHRLEAGIPRYTRELLLPRTPLPGCESLPGPINNVEISSSVLTANQDCALPMANFKIMTSSDICQNSFHTYGAETS
jgi:hypothetical protein